MLIAVIWTRTDVAGFTTRTKFPSFYRTFLRLKELGVGRNKRQSFTNGPDVVLVIVKSVYGNQPSALWKFIGSSSNGSDAQERREWTLPAERFGPGSGCMPQNSTSAYCQGYAHVTSMTVHEIVGIEVIQVQSQGRILGRFKSHVHLRRAGISNCSH